jgi:hypothetical protein
LAATWPDWPGTDEQSEQDPAVWQRVCDASPVFLASRDDPPAIVLRENE